MKSASLLDALQYLALRQACDERWGEPKPIGAVWLRFYLDPLGDLQFDVVSAVV